MKRYILSNLNIIFDMSKMSKLDLELVTSINRTSDNLIDLLDEGDLSEDIFDNIVLVDNPEELHFQKKHYREFPEQLFAIWKRQGNIFRRYVK